MNKIGLIKQLLDNSMLELRRSCDWYVFKIIPLQEKYRTEIDGNLMKRTWYFVLKVKE